ncbi:hypothetical protein B296_00017826 [Ensete ventricosum]|uniref:Retrotransposon gag domain-containing protein n=1 Tax=Ensete ventricosum TaxID=4639 RepID=A0A426ZKT0_ENSVE|nr:hypothetical protein B296_00017826 [Ensete ventricosum]
MASVDLFRAKLEAFKTCMEDRLRALFEEFKLDRSPSPRRSQHSRSFDHKESPTKKQVMDSSCLCPRLDFPRWEDRDPTGWISCLERYFLYHKTQEASMIDIATIHVGREAAQWYD